MNIALVDSSTDMDLFLKEHENYSLIVAFDYESHNILSSNNITHKISDEFTNDIELTKLQKESYHYAKWFEIGEISKLITFKDINIGELFYAEFHYYLVPILKKFNEVTKILKEFPSANFSSTGIIFKITSEFLETVSLLHPESKKNEGFLNDSIKKTFKLGKKEISLNNSKKSYLIIFQNEIPFKEK